MKTVTFDDEAYALLRHARLRPRESFSQVVKRTLGGRPSWSTSAGGWADMSDDEARALRAESVEAFGWTTP